MIDTTLLESPGWMAAGWTMLHFLWVGTILGVAGALARWLLVSSGPNVRYAVALVCMSALAAAPMVIALWVFEAPVVVDVPDPLILELQEPLATRDAPQLISMPPPIPTPIVADELPTSPTQVTLLERVVRWLPCFWLAGAPLVFVVFATGLMGAERLSRESRRLESSDLPAICERLASSLKIVRHVVVRVSDRINSPVLLGILRPVILLPPAAISGWSPDQIEMVLLHELAHVRRWDNLVNLLQRVVESILFFHPAVWWVSRWVRLEREFACDTVVVAQTGRPNTYAEILARLTVPNIPVGAAAGAMAENDTVVRIRRILNLEDSSMKLSHKVLGVCSILILAPVLLVAANAARSDADDTQGPHPVTAEQVEDGASEADESPSKKGAVQPQALPATTKNQLLVTSFHTGSADVFLLNLRDGKIKNLTNSENHAFGASWSPDGKKIVFVKRKGRGENIYVMDSDGQNVKQLTTSGLGNMQPAWSPNGKNIAFRRYVEGLDWEIFVMDANGENKKNLTNSPLRETDPDWSPDGKKFVFTVGSYSHNYNVSVMNTDGSNVRKLNERRASFAYPTWSPDGKKITYTLFTNLDENDWSLSDLEVFVSNADGTNEKQLTTLGGLNTMATWSPDGRRIAFVHDYSIDNHSDNPNREITLWLMDADGSNQRKINVGTLKFELGWGRFIAWRPR